MVTTGGRTNRLLTAFAIAIIVLISACSSEEPVVIQPPPLDPRFASADAILETYNAVVTQKPRVDPQAWLGLMYTENEKQKAMLETVRANIPYMELEQVVYERFGELLNPDTKTPPFAQDSPAAITERNGPRALANGIDADGKQYILHLVQIGDRWWVSGYTLEYVSWGKRSTRKHQEYARFNAFVSEAASTITQRITAGEITSAEQARRALGAELARRSR